MTEPLFLAPDCFDRIGQISTYDSVPVGSDEREQHLWRSVCERMAQRQQIVNAMLPQARATIMFLKAEDVIKAEMPISFVRIALREGFAVAFRSAEDRTRYCERLDLIRGERA